MMQNVRLSKRLMMVSRMVKSGGIVADVGCDHAHTAIYLVRAGLAQGAIAMDLREGPLQHAARNIRLYGCGCAIETRLSDGIALLRPGEADTILIAGMGGGLMVEILGRNPETVNASRELVLSPQSHIGDVRHFLHKIRFDIIDEDMCFEDGKYYVAIRAVPCCDQEPAYSSEELYMYGERLLAKRSRELEELLAHERRKALGVIARLKGNESQDAIRRLAVFERKLRLTEAALDHYRKQN